MNDRDSDGPLATLPQYRVSDAIRFSLKGVPWRANAQLWLQERAAKKPTHRAIAVRLLKSEDHRHRRRGRRLS